MNRLYLSPAVEAAAINANVTHVAANMPHIRAMGRMARNPGVGAHSGRLALLFLQEGEDLFDLDHYSLAWEDPQDDTRYAAEGARALGHDTEPLDYGDIWQQADHLISVPVNNWTEPDLRQAAWRELHASAPSRLRDALFVSGLGGLGLGLAGPVASNRVITPYQPLAHLWMPEVNGAGTGLAVGAVAGGLLYAGNHLWRRGHPPKGVGTLTPFTLARR
jgi:hypothetical protein